MSRNNYSSLLLLFLAQLTLMVYPAQALEGERLYRLCAKFPLNSQCQGYVRPIALKERPGSEAKCLMSGEDKPSDCKISLSESQVSVFTEYGKKLAVLEDARDTKETTISEEQIQSIYYSESSKTDVGAVIAFGLPGLFAKVKKATIRIRYEPMAEGESWQSLVMVSKRKYGREMRSELEEITGLTAELIAID